MKLAAQLCAARCRTAVRELAQPKADGLTPRARTELAAAIAALRATASGGGGGGGSGGAGWRQHAALWSQPGFTHLLQMLTPVIVATPRELALWLQRPIEFDTVVVDGADAMSAASVAGALARLEDC